MKSVSGFLCEIVPIIPIPYGKGEVFSYLSERQIPTGSLVLIPFGPREVRGVSLSCTGIVPGQKTGIRLKQVREIIEESFLTEQQLSLAEHVSCRCLTPLGKTLRHFLPTRTKERSPKNHGTERKPVRMNGTETIAIGKMFGGTGTVFLEAPREHTLRIISGMARKLPKGTQTLVLVPERIALPGAERFFSSVFGTDRVAVLSGSAAPGTFFAAWESVRSRDIRIIIGTRQALFAPFRKLGLVVLLEESEILGYKQWDMSPRYDTRDVAERLAAIHGARYVLSGETMSEEMLLGTTQKAVERIVVPAEPEHAASAARITLVDMRGERFRKNRSIISETLKSAFLSARSRGEKSLLIVSRSGLDRFSVCEDCRTIPRCPRCDRALRSTRDGHFRCGSCSFRTTTFPRCTTCGSLSFRNIGSGTEKVEQELKRYAPGANITRIDEQTLRGPRAEVSVFEAAERADAVVGTPSSLNIGTLPKIGLVAILDAENLLSFPDFRADERFARMVRRAGRTVSETDKGSVIIQTFRPEQELLRNLRDGTERVVLDRALADRNTLRYPPFFSIFRIGFRNRDEAETERIAEKAYGLFSRADVSGKDIRISPPRKPLSPKTRGKYERFIIVSCPAGSPFPSALRDILMKFQDWTFDPGPLSLI